MGKRNVRSIAFAAVAITVITAAMLVFVIEKNRIEAEHRDVLATVKAINDTPAHSVFREVKNTLGRTVHERCDSNGFCFQSSHRADLEIATVKRSAGSGSIPVFDLTTFCEGMDTASELGRACAKTIASKL